MNRNLIQTMPSLLKSKDALIKRFFFIFFYSENIQELKTWTKLYEMKQNFIALDHTKISC